MKGNAQCSNNFSKIAEIKYNPNIEDNFYAIKTKKLIKYKFFFK